MKNSKWNLLRNAKLNQGIPDVFVTDSQRWANSFELALDFAEIYCDQQDFNLKVTIDLRVLSGAIGVSVISKDGDSIIGNEVCSSESLFRHILELNIDKWNNAKSIIIRKTSSSNEEVKFEVFNTFVELVPVPLINYVSIEKGSDAKKFQPDHLFQELRKKWFEVPSGRDDRAFTSDLLMLSDEELVLWWEKVRKESTAGIGYPIRGWYNDLYKNQFKGKSVADIGSGMGIDGVYFAVNGAEMTFADIASTNLKVIERLLSVMGVTSANFLHLESMETIDDLSTYDFMWCQGSMINAPYKTMKEECRLLLEHLPKGGRWIELCYPKERWLREGALPFAEWGERTDGTGTPWMEWYDLERLLARLEPAKFETILSLNFHNDDFNWFDLKKVS